MNSSWYKAPGHLEGILRGIWTIKTDKSEDLDARVLPDATPYLVFQRDGTKLTSTDNAGVAWARCCLSGPRTKEFDVRIESSSHLFIVQLSSIGGLPVLGIPMKEVSDLCEDVTHVVDESSSMTELSDRLMGAPSEFECIKLLESWVATRIASSSTNKIMEQVIAEMNKTSGNCAVSSLAKQVDLSRRHLGRLVQQEVGLSPKQLGKVIRFDRAVQLGRIRPGRSLSRIAFQSGYSDQAHMTREFRQLGGITPSAIQRDSGALIW